MKKRFLSLVMALTMALALVLPASAAGTGWSDALGELAGAGGSGDDKLYVLMILNSATNARKNVVASEDGSDVEQWQNWVTPEMLADFDTKLELAHAYYLSWENLTPARKEEAAAAALSLQNALTDFKNAQKPGYKSDSSTPEEPVKLPFPDVVETDWYYPYVAKVYELKLFSGTPEGTFLPLNAMTYNQFYAVLYQFSGETAQVTDFSYYVQWAQAKGLVPQELMDVQPSAPITRQDMAAVFAAFLKAYNVSYSNVTNTPASFTDQDKIASYAAGGVSVCWQAGIMGGGTDGTFNPNGTACRAEVAVTMVQMARIMGRT